MTGFEFISVFFSVVLGLATTRIMGGIAALVEARKRVKLDWIHILWIVNILSMNLQLWWGSWGLQDFHNWNFRAFALVVSAPGILYLLSDLLIPNDINAAPEPNMTLHYENTRPAFFLLLWLYTFLSIIANHTVFGVPVFSLVMALPGTLGLGALIGIFTRSRVFHAVYAILTIAGVVAFISLDKQVIR